MFILHGPLCALLGRVPRPLVSPLVFACMWVWMDEAQFQELNAETVMDPVAPHKASPYQPQALHCPWLFSFRAGSLPIQNLVDNLTGVLTKVLPDLVQHQVSE